MIKLTIFYGLEHMVQMAYRLLEKYLMVKLIHAFDVKDMGAQTPSPWFSIDSLGTNSLFLGQNYPMMVQGNPAAFDTTLLYSVSPN